MIKNGIIDTYLIHITNTYKNRLNSLFKIIVLGIFISIDLFFTILVTISYVFFKGHQKNIKILCKPKKNLESRS